MTVPTNRPLLPALIIVACAGAAHAQCIDAQKVIPTGTIAADGVGSAVRLSGTSMLLSAPAADLPGKADAGAVYAWYWVPNIQNQYSWAPYAKITASDAAANATFGKAIAFSDPWAAILTPAASGAVYMFARNGNTWQQFQKLASPSGSEDFGASLAVDGDWMIVGSPGHDQGAPSPSTNYGAARIYKRSGTTWTERVFLSRPSIVRRPGDRFAESVAIRGTIAAVGTPNFYDVQTQSTIGAVSLYTRSGDTWSNAGTVLAPDNADGDRFGASVAIDGDWIFIGAPGHGPADVGAVYIFRRTSGAAFEFQQKITPISAAASGHFGSELSVETNRLAVASAGAKVVSVFILANGTWHHDYRVFDPDTAANGAFAGSVAISGTHLAIGDPLDDNASGTNAGAAYALRFTATGADTCAAAPEAGQGVYTGCTQRATLDGNAGCYGLSTSPDVWYRYTAPCTGTVLISTFGSLFDTTLSIHSGCPGTMNNALVCNDDWSVFEDNAQVQLSTAEGETYLIRIGGSGGERGAYQLNIGACTPNPAACYANCDQSTTPPVLNVDDFTCFINKYAQAQSLPHAQQLTADANCDNSTTAPVLNVDDFTCFINNYAQGCP